VHKLTSFSNWISEKSKAVEDVKTENVGDAEHVKQSLEFLKASITIKTTKSVTEPMGLIEVIRKMTSQDYNGLFPFFVHS
jgi:hypothetical protein